MTSSQNKLSNKNEQAGPGIYSSIPTLAKNNVPVLGAIQGLHYFCAPF